MQPPRITLQRKFHSTADGLTPAQCQIIADHLRQQQVTRISVVGDAVEFENAFFHSKHGRTHLMAPLTAGRFMYSHRKQTLVYQFSVWHAFLLALCLSLFFGIMAGSIYAVLFFFIWLFGMNLLITSVRHRNFLKTLTKSLQSPPIHNS